MRVRELIGRLGAVSGERAALSLILERRDAGLMVRAGSLVIGPAGVGELSWPGWRTAEGESFGIQPVEVPAEFIVDLGHSVAGRATMTPPQATAWLKEACESRTAPAVGPLPAAQTPLGPAAAPIRVSTHAETPAGNLAVHLGRPIRAFHFPAATEHGRLSPGDSWDIDGFQVYSPALTLLGIGWFDGMSGPGATGLLVGRMERRAWLGGQRLDAVGHLYELMIHLEPERAELAELELDIEEWVGEEVVVAERLRLEDLDLRDVEDQPRITVQLPTLGRKVKRAVRLYHRDGEMLDEWQPFNIVEAIGLTLTVDGAEQPTTWIGDRREGPELVELLGAAERVRAQFAEMRRGGLVQRLIDDRAAGRRALRRLLERAGGEVTVVDPYLKDWDLLMGLDGPPPRVLIGARAPDPPPQFTGRVARWRGGGEFEVAPFHDRFFLWDGGGVSVGTSSGPGEDRLFRLVRISDVESRDLRERFALWWGDPDFERLR